MAYLTVVSLRCSRWVGPGTAVAFLVLLAARPASAQSPDFRGAGDEAVQLLQQLVRIDTSNPPGNEGMVADHLRSLFEAEGISVALFAKDPARANLVARLPGNGSRPPLLLMAHSDVVGVERESWTVSPFDGVVADGYVYGRGSQDDKGQVAAMAEVLLMLARAGVTLDRDIILLVEAGEEGTTEWGIDYMVESHLEEIRADFALNEGGSAHITLDGSVDRVDVATTEKVGYRGVRLVAHGVAGHGSRPRPDNPVVHLAAAVAKVGEHQMPVRLNETTREYFKRMADISPPEEAFLYRNVDDAILGPMVQEYFRQNDFLHNSILRTSVSPNIITGGFRRNVIPTRAEAELDVRMAPGDDIEAVLAELEQVIDDPAVEVIPPTSWRPAGDPSPLDSDLFRALEHTQEQMFPDAATLPTMLTSATDGAQLRAVGIPTYGVGIPSAEASRAHGNDERVSVTGLRLFVEYLYRTVMRVGGAQIGAD